MNMAKLKTELPEYSVNGKEKNYSSPYTVSARDCEKKIVLDKDTSITCDVTK